MLAGYQSQALSPALPAQTRRLSPFPPFPGPGSPLAVGCLGLHSSGPWPSTRKAAEHRLHPWSPTSSKPQRGLARRFLLPLSWRLGTLRPWEKPGRCGVPERVGSAEPRPPAPLARCPRQRPFFEAPQTQPWFPAPAHRGPPGSSCLRLPPRRQGRPGLGLVSASFPEICLSKCCKQMRFLCNVPKMGCAGAAC